MIDTTLSPDQLDRLAIALRRAGQRHQPIAPLTDEIPDLSIADAYAIARRNVDARLAGGARVVGHKVGLTSIAVQQQLGVGEPDYGVLLDVMEIADGATVAAPRFIAPRVELELAFHLRERLAGPDVTADEVRRATAAVQPAIELVDSRIEGWRIRLADTVADQASSAGFVLGGARRPLDDVDVSAVQATLTRNGEAIEHGRADAVLGDPCRAVAWLANALAPLGQALEPGHIVLSGACTRMAPAAAGDAFAGDFGALGRIALTFGEAQW